MTNLNESLNDCQSAFDKYMETAFNGKISYLKEIVWDAFKTSWEKQKIQTAPVSIHPGNECKQTEALREAGNFIAALLPTLPDNYARQGRETLEVVKGALPDKQLQDVKNDVLEGEIMNNTSDMTCWEKKYNDLLQSSRDFMKNAGKYEEIIENALNNKKDILDKLIYLHRDHAPGYEQWWVMLNLGRASLEGKNHIIIQRFGKKEDAEAFKDAITAIGDEGRGVPSAEAPTVSGVTVTSSVPQGNSTLNGYADKFYELFHKMPESVRKSLSLHQMRSIFEYMVKPLLEAARCEISDKQKLHDDIYADLFDRVMIVKDGNYTGSYNSAIERMTKNILAYVKYHAPKREIVSQDRMYKCLKAILLTDERGQGLPFQEAMDEAADICNEIEDGSVNG